MKLSIAECRGTQILKITNKHLLILSSITCEEAEDIYARL